MRQVPAGRVDSTYYGMPKPGTPKLWVARTEPGFLFDVKSFSLFTSHSKPIIARREDIRDQLRQLRENIYLEQTPDKACRQWDPGSALRSSLRAAGRLGAVFFQFLPWFLSHPDRSPTSSNTWSMFGVPGGGGAPQA